MPEKLVFKFEGLGFWRKLYLIFQWITSLSIAGFSIFVLLRSEQTVVVPLLIVTAAALSLAYWIHRAVVERTLKQLKILILVNLLVANFIGFLVLISVLRQSTKELSQYGLPLE